MPHAALRGLYVPIVTGEIATPQVRLPFLAAGESSVRRAELALEAAR